MDNLSEVIELYRLIVEDVFNDMISEYFETLGLKADSRFTILISDKDNA